MKLNNQSGVSKEDAWKLVFRDMIDNGPYSLKPPKRVPEPDRAMMTDEEQLATPERGLEEDEFLPYPGAYGQMDVMPIMGALTPAQRAAKAGYKKAVKAQQDLATGGFDKIKRMLGLEKLVRDSDEARAVVKTRIGNPLSHQLPVDTEQIQPMMRQKALQDTRAALKQRAERLSSGKELPKGGYYLGIEPLDDTVVKGAHLHKDFGLFDEGEIPDMKRIFDDPITKEKAQIGSKFGVSHPYDRREILEAIDLDARKRLAADEILSKKDLAPESMMVRLPENTYIVQDKAKETLEQVRAKAWLERELEQRRLERAKYDGAMMDDYADKAMEKNAEKYNGVRRQLDKDTEALREQVGKAGLHTSDFHMNNVMYDRHGKPVVVDTQDFVPSTGELQPLPKKHWRVIRKPR